MNDLNNCTIDSCPNQRRKFASKAVNWPFQVQHANNNAMFCNVLEMMVFLVTQKTPVSQWYDFSWSFNRMLLWQHIHGDMIGLIPKLIFVEWFVVFVSLEPIELVPKMIRRPTHLDHYLCRQLHNGPGLRALAVTNLSGQLCRTYCRVMDRIGGKIFYTENTSPNFVRCGPYQARCVDGNCVGFNYPNGIISTLLNHDSSSSINNEHNNPIIIDKNQDDSLLDTDAAVANQNIQLSSMLNQNHNATKRALQNVFPQ